MYRSAAIIAVLLALAPTAFAGPETNQAPPQLPHKTVKRVITIPRGNPSLKHSATGKMILLALLPSGMRPAVVVYYIDDKEIARVDHRPYDTEWDSAGVVDGEHTVLWKALSADNQELATGCVILITGIEAKAASAGDNTTNSEPKPQMERYSSAEHDVSLEYPADWTVKDESGSVSKDWEKGYWLVLSTDPVAQAVYVVNIRHRLLKTDHTADSFVKNTPYLADWQRTTIGNRAAFVTTAGLPSAKRVVHRIQMIEGRNLWMINCIDTSGKAVDDSRSVVLKIAESIKLFGADAGNSQPATGDSSTNGEDLE